MFNAWGSSPSSKSSAFLENLPPPTITPKRSQFKKISPPTETEIQKKKEEEEKIQNNKNQRSANIRKRMKRSGTKVITTNRMTSALEFLRNAQEKIKQEKLKEELKIKEIKRKEKERIEKLIEDKKIAIKNAVASKDYKILSSLLDDLKSVEGDVHDAIESLIENAEENLIEFESSLSPAEKQVLNQGRILEAKTKLLNLKSDPTQHYNLILEIGGIMCDEVLHESPELLEEINDCNRVISERKFQQDEKINALEKAMSSKNKNVNKNIKELEIAMQELSDFVPAVKPEILASYIQKQGLMKRRWAMMAQLEALLKRLNSRSIAEMKSLRKPDEDILDVMCATMILLGEPAKDLTEWKPIKVLLGKTGKLSIKRRISEHVLEDVKESTWQEATKCMLKIKDVNHIQKKSEGAAIFYAWNKGVLDEISAEHGFKMEGGKGGDEWM